MLDLQTLIGLELNTSSIDDAISQCGSDPLLSEIGEVLTDLKENITEASEQGLELAANDNVDLQKMFITINGSIVTGGLIGSILVESSGSRSYTIEPGVEYAVFVEGGRGDVYPVVAKCLHWVDYGVDVFRMHSGPARPRPFVEPAFERTDGGRAVQFVEEAINNVL